MSVSAWCARVAVTVSLMMPTLWVGSAQLAAAAGGSAWPVGGQNIRDMRYQAVTSITPANVGNLKLSWVFSTQGDVSATPAVIGGSVFFPDWGGNFYALNAATGQLRWTHKISDWTGVPGDISRNSPVIDSGKIILGDLGGLQASFSPKSGLTGPGGRVMAVDVVTGKPLWVTQVDTFPGALITGSPVVYNGRVYVGVSSREESLAPKPGYTCCTFQGSLVALDEATGHILWKTYFMPPNGGRADGYSGGAVWQSTPAIDVKRSSIYVATGNNYNVPARVQACIERAQKRHQSDSVCDPVENYAQNYFDAVLSLDLQTGAIKWAQRMEGYDAANFACGFVPPGVTWCPSPMGPDYDFGAGPNLITTVINGQPRDLVGVGQKSGVYWALDADTGSIVWHRLVGPGGMLGGIEWGTATNGRAIYIPLTNTNQTPYTLQPSGLRANGGSWSALNTATGQILWQTATPGTCQGPGGGSTGGCLALGPVSLAGQVVFGGSMDKNPANPTMFALDAATGRILWSYAPGSSVVAAPAIVDGTVYWGSGYTHAGPNVGTGNNKLFAFSLP